MKNGFFSEHWTDDLGRPSGGCSSGRGFTISWQNGPLGRGNARREPNGAFVEDVIDACVDRIKFYNCSGFGCQENYVALEFLEAAMKALNDRTARREKDGVEGTHEGN